MSFTELVKAVAKRAGVPERSARVILRAFLQETGTTLEAGERVVLPGFGTFHLQRQKPRSLFGGTRVTSKDKIKFRESRRK